MGRQLSHGAHPCDRLQGDLRLERIRETAPPPGHGWSRVRRDECTLTRRPVFGEHITDPELSDGRGCVAPKADESRRQTSHRAWMGTTCNCKGICPPKLAIDLTSGTPSKGFDPPINLA